MVQSCLIAHFLSRDCFLYHLLLVIVAMVVEGVMETAVQVCSVVVEAGVGGVKIGVVTVHLLQVVTVSVVRNVDVLVIISTDVLPPLWWVVVETGQLVTVV